MYFHKYSGSNQGGACYGFTSKHPFLSYMHEGNYMSARLLTAKTSLRQISLRFFDLYVNIKSDCEAFLDLFAQMYRRFMVDMSPPGFQPTVDFTLLAEPGDRYDTPVIIVDNEIWPLSHSRLFEGYAYECVLSTIVLKQARFF